jgi:hypothetical protein
VIVEPWKVIVDQTSERRWLYDLAIDPLERNNLTFANPAKLTEMEQLLSSELSRATHGWHLRACGGDEATEIKFTSHGVLATVNEDALEEEDSVTVAETGDGDVSVRFVLRPYDATREFFGRFLTQRLRDQDELRIEQDPPAPLQLLSNTELRFVLGASSAVQTGRTIDLAASRTDATVPSTSVIRCPPTPPGFTTFADAELGKSVPLLRVWYVEPPTALSAASVDPAVAERLRALGYLW